MTPTDSTTANSASAGADGSNASNAAGSGRRSEEPRHPIRVVATRTGLTPSALRAWERRYGLVEPARSEGGQRLYSDRDIERLDLLKRITDAGRSIGDVADLPMAEIRRLAAEDEAARRDLQRREVTRETGPESVTGAATFREEAMEAIRDLNADALDSILRRAAAVLGGLMFMEEVVAPVLRQVGDEWARGELRPAHEHVATGVIRRVLHWLADPVGDASGPSIVIGTLPGERHELGAMLAVATAALEGWHVTFLGIDLPPIEISNAAARVDAQAVALGVSRPAGGEELVEGVRQLRTQLRPDVELILGGSGGADVPAQVGMAGVRRVESLSEFRTSLRAIAAAEA